MGSEQVLYTTKMASSGVVPYIVKNTSVAIYRCFSHMPNDMCIHSTRSLHQCKVRRIAFFAQVWNTSRTVSLKY